MTELFNRPYNGYAFLHKNGSDQAITGDASGGGVTKVTFSTASKDTRSWFDNANDRLTVNRTGLYLAKGQIWYTGGIAAGNTMLARLHVNGSAVTQTQINAPSTADVPAIIVDFLELVAGDYVELHGYKGGANSTIYGNNSTFTFLKLAWYGPLL